MWTQDFGGPIANTDSFLRRGGTCSFQRQLRQDHLIMFLKGNASACSRVLAFVSSVSIASPNMFCLFVPSPVGTCFSHRGSGVAAVRAKFAEWRKLALCCLGKVSFSFICMLFSSPGRVAGDPRCSDEVEQLRAALTGRFVSKTPSLIIGAQGYN